MKKSFFIPAALLGAMLFTPALTGCDKNKENTDLQSTVSQSNAEQGVTSEEDFENVLKTSLELLNNENHLSIKSVEGGYIFEVLAGHEPPVSEKVVCSWGGNQLTLPIFLKCCDGWVKAHGCIRVTFDNGTYNGNSCD